MMMRERGALADAGNAEHEIEAAGEIVVGAQMLWRCAQLGARAAPSAARCRP